MGAAGEEYDYLFRVVLVGDSGVGKTNLLLRFTKNEFNRDSHSTIGVDFMSKSFTIDNKKVKAIIWDTAGQDRFRSIATSFYRGSSAALLVYDITNEKTFENIGRWLEDVKKYGDVNMVFCLVGNKCDLESQRKVSVDAGKEYAIKNNMSFIETSALDSTNVEKAFVNLIKDVYFVYSRFKKEPDTQQAQPPRLLSPPPELNSIQVEDTSRKKKCCNTT